MRSHAFCVLFLTGLLTVGCAHSNLAVRPVSYDLDVAVEPAEHTIDAEVAVELEPLDAAPSGKRRRVELLLHPDLEVQSVDVTGATLRAHKQRKGKSVEGSVTRPARHRLILENPAETIRVTFSYDGLLNQDVSSGEKAGEIHNFGMSAHVAGEGIYLAPSGYWYPRVDLPEDSDPHNMLSNYALAVRPVEGFELVAGVERRDPREDGALQWSSPFPLDGLVLLGGPLERSSRTHGDIELHAVLAPGKQDVAEDILDASAEYLDLYQELIGPYPFSEFTVLEAFFSSGFAFPTCTQIAGSQLSRHQQYRRHGYLDHELLHNWYGNGIFVDPDAGNWCEGLASYMGNYYGYVLEGDEKGARKQRRDQSNFLSAIAPEDDKPLGTFGQDGGAGRGIGYQKTASVFHMLERKIGAEAMFAGLRRFTDEQMGKYANWDHLQGVFEQESGEDLDTFFDQWVHRGGAPMLELVDAEHTPGADRVRVTISQGQTGFELDVPLRLHYGDRHQDVVVAMNAAVDTIDVPCEPDGLTAVELDPDYHLFRRLKPDEVMPTSSLTRRAQTLLVVVPEGELAEGYQVLLDATRDAVLDEEGNTVVLRESNELEAAELLESSVLVLGDAARHPAIVEFLDRTRSPLDWTAAGFEIDDAAYSGPRQAVYMTVHHPDLFEGGVTVYYGNSAEALSNARVLSFYGNSLLVFDTPEGAGIESGDEMPRAEVIRRMDFEFHERIEFGD